MVVLLAMVAISSSPALAQENEGWAISPDKVTVTNIRPGESISGTVTVSNNKDFPAVVSMSAEIPYVDNLTPGYEPIPDTDWISLTPQQFELEQYSEQEVQITVTVPSSGDWGGKRYECWLRATLDTMGILQVKLDSRLLLSTAVAYAGGINWVLIGAIAGAMVVAGAVVFNNRRELKKWAGRW
jgi:hypothetical protein